MKFLTYSAVLLALPLCAQVAVTQPGGHRITINIDNKPFTDPFAAEPTQ